MLFVVDKRAKGVNGQLNGRTRKEELGNCVYSKDDRRGLGMVTSCFVALL